MKAAEKSAEVTPSPMKRQKTNDDSKPSSKLAAKLKGQASDSLKETRPAEAKPSKKEMKPGKFDNFFRDKTDTWSFQLFSILCRFEKPFEIKPKRKRQRKTERKTRFRKQSSRNVQISTKSRQTQPHQSG